MSGQYRIFGAEVSPYSVKVRSAPAFTFRTPTTSSRLTNGVLTALSTLD